MSQTLQRALFASALIAGALLAGCEKKTTSTDTPAGSSTTTSVSATPGASAAMSGVGEAVTDTVITAKVKTALLADSEVKGLKIDVDTQDGVVTLTGELAAQGNVDRAVTLAKAVEGVKSVQSKLTVKS